MFTRPTNHDEDNRVIDSEATIIDSQPTSHRTSNLLPSVGTQTEPTLEGAVELVEFSPKQKRSIFQRLKTKTAAALVGSAVMLPILAVGTTTYYFGSQAVNKQIILARRADIELADRGIVRQQQLLAALLIGTGTTALLAGAVSAWVTKRLLDFKSNSKARETEAQTEEDGFVQNLSQFISPKEIKILKSAVEEARSSLKCDRAVVYSLAPEQYGVILAESVAFGHTEVLVKSIENPCFEPKYFEQYGNGRVQATDNIYPARTTGDRKSKDAKANLVTPIFTEGRLFGLLVVHQDAASRQRQKTEIEFLHQLADKTGWALSRSKLLNEIVRLQTHLEKEREWTNYFTQATQHIRQSIKQEDILEVSVEEARRVLGCDRVVVYSLNCDSYGVVIAESVAPGYTRALNKTIEDPCLAARYLDKYRDGRVRAIDNIDEARMSGHYLEQLKTLEVKAILVTPIFNESKLFGLLVAHQCSQPRHWQDYEIRWMSLVATQVGFALDNAKVLARSTIQQAEVQQEREWTNYFTQATQHIRQSIKQEDILEISVEEARRVLGCDRVVVYSLNCDSYGVVIAESVAPGYTRALNKTIEDPCLAARYLDKYRDGRVRAIDNIDEARMSGHYLEQLKTLEVKAILVTPIFNESKLFGLLVAHQCSQPRHWQDYEIRWMSLVATQVGFALDNAQLLKKLKNDSLPTKLLNNFSLSLSEDTSELNLLKNAVEQARKIIDLDRVIIVRFACEGEETIVAESVVAGYSRALYSEVKDALAKDYAKSDPKQIQTVVNIERANLTQQHLERLKLLEVKASISVPIWQEQQLFGLLIGHQCSRSRLWEQGEIDLFAQLGLQLGLALKAIELKTEIAQNHDAHQAEISQQQLEQQNLQQQISELLAENQAALQNLKANMTVTEAIPTHSFPVTEATEIEVFQQPRHYLTVNLDDDLSEQITTVELPMIEVKRSPNLSDKHNSEVQVITGELVENTESESSSKLINQFAGEISNLSSQISQQSLIMTESFQKLATFARQLSEKE